jgi:NADPH-dependent 2,4-dienoyl-CoA reductase/sulfur reductase-like enzyme
MGESAKERDPCMIEQRKIVIIGSSIAGITAADAARKQDPEAVITVVSRDTHLPYYRLRICELIDNPDVVSQ